MDMNVAVRHRKRISLGNSHRDKETRRLLLRFVKVAIAAAFAGSECREYRNDARLKRARLPLDDG